MTGEMKGLYDNLSIDYRIMRVVLASSNPLETVQEINSDRYSIIALLDTLEILDAKITLEEYENKRIKAQQQ